MAEVGLLPFTPVASETARVALPPYRGRFNKRHLTRSQLMAIRCLMRYEDWTFRETEVRLGEHCELRRVLGLSSVPDYTRLYRFLKGLEDAPIQDALGATARRLRGARQKGRRRARVV